MKADHEKYMRLALEEAAKAASEGEIPIGAVIVCQGEVIARAHNLRETLRDATAHAELLAIAAACRALGRWRLTGCALYVTVEPCPMCSGAVVNSRLDSVVYGCPDARAGGCESIFNIVSNPNLNHAAGVISGVLEEDCAKVMRDFFRARRGASKAREEDAKAAATLSPGKE